MISKLSIVLEFKKRLQTVSEIKQQTARLEHLEKRYQIDKVSDSPEAREIKEEIQAVKDKIQELLNQLSF